MHTGSAPPTNDTLTHCSSEELYRIIGHSIRVLANRFQTAPDEVAAEFASEFEDEAREER